MNRRDFFYYLYKDRLRDLADRMSNQIVEILNDVLVEERIVCCFPEHRRSDYFVIGLSVSVRLFTHIILHNFIIVVNVFYDPVYTLSLLIPTLIIQYSIRFLQSVIAQFQRLVSERTIEEIKDHSQCNEFEEMAQNILEEVGESTMTIKNRVVSYGSI